MTPTDVLLGSIDDIEKSLMAAARALRSYQNGNSAPGLAESVADHCEAALTRLKPVQSSLQDAAESNDDILSAFLHNYILSTTGTGIPLKRPD